MRISIVPDGILLDFEYKKIDEIVQPEEAQELAWKLLRAAHFLHSERKYEGTKPVEDLMEFIKANPPKGPFKPHAYYNVDGNQLEVCWSDEQDYTQSIEGGMCLHRSQEDHKVVGVTIYGIQRVMSIDTDSDKE
jgi:hypothetical protein